MKDINALLVHIEHTKPIEINEFAQSLNAVGNLFSSFAQNKGDSKQIARSKLYVEKIEEGSIDIILCEMATASLIPFVENMNVIFEFSSYIKGIIEYFAQGKGEKPQLSLQDLKSLKELFQPTSEDKGGKTVIGAIANGKKSTVYNGCTFNFYDSNSSQNQIEKEIEAITSVRQDEGILRNQLMVIYQKRSDIHADSGNKAIIDAISKNKVGVVFDTEELKSQILHADYNPAKKAFYVDVSVMTANGRIAAYKVMALHDIIDLD